MTTVAGISATSGAILRFLVASLLGSAVGARPMLVASLHLYEAALNADRRSARVERINQRAPP